MKNNLGLCSAPTTSHHDPEDCSTLSYCTGMSFSSDENEGSDSGKEAIYASSSPSLVESVSDSQSEQDWQEYI